MGKLSGFSHFVSYAKISREKTVHVCKKMCVFSLYEICKKLLNSLFASATMQREVNIRLCKSPEGVVKK